MRKSAMTITRVAAASALLLAVASCTPSIRQDPSPSSVVTAIFDPAGGDIPLPSDLVLQAPATLPVPAAQKELLTLFQAQGGFPNDQEVAVTISFARDRINADGSLTRVGPGHRPGLVHAQHLLRLRRDLGRDGAGEIELDPISAGDLAIGPSADGQGQVTTLTLHHKGRTPWAPGQYAVLVRGGHDGVKTVEGDPIWPSSVFFLVAQGQDMTKPENLMLLQAQAGSHDAALALATQLNQIIVASQPAFAACDQRFPHQELASMAGFTVAPARTQVDLDPGRGLVPLPIDLLRDPRPASASCASCGMLTPLAACTLAAGTLDPVSGACSSAAAAGFAALDGFSTTAPLLAPTNDLIEAATVTPTTYRLYDLTNPAAPVLVNPATYLTEPVEFTQSGLSPVVASQPVGATAADPSSPFRTRPLKENTSYAVVITTGVKDKTGAPLGRGTVGSVLLFDNPLVDGAGKSQLLGIDDLTAGALEVMRQRLLPVRAVLAAETTPVTKAGIAMAYTFKTQSILGVATQLAALPYQQAAIPALANLALPGPISVSTPAAAFNAYGVAPVIPSSNIDEVIETDIITYNLLDRLTGAFNPAEVALEKIHVMITTPKASAAQLCAGAMAPFGSLGVRCAPLMVFRHGLGGGRAQMLLAADSFAAKGMVTVAIDAAKHGDRAYCTTGSTNQCLPGSTCQAVPGFGTQGDSSIPGRCTSGATNGDGFPARNPVAGGTCPDGAFTCGIPVFSSNYVISANFFRTRDTFRQDIIDQSQLILVMAFAPSGAPPTGHPVFDHMVGRGAGDRSPAGLLLRPVARRHPGDHGRRQPTRASPRRCSTSAVARIVDIFTTSPAFSSGVNQLLAAMGIVPGTSELPAVPLGGQADPRSGRPHQLRRPPHRQHAAQPAPAAGWRHRRLGPAGAQEDPDAGGPLRPGGPQHLELRAGLPTRARARCQARRPSTRRGDGHLPALHEAHRRSGVGRRRLRRRRPARRPSPRRTASSSTGRIRPWPPGPRETPQPSSSTTPAPRRSSCCPRGPPPCARSSPSRCSGPTIALAGGWSIPNPDARALALAQAGVANQTGPEAISMNVAGLAGQQGFAVTGSLQLIDNKTSWSDPALGSASTDTHPTFPPLLAASYGGSALQRHGLGRRRRLQRPGRRLALLARRLARPVPHRDGEPAGGDVPGRRGHPAAPLAQGRRRRHLLPCHRGADPGHELRRPGGPGRGGRGRRRRGLRALARGGGARASRSSSAPTTGAGAT